MSGAPPGLLKRLEERRRLLRGLCQWLEKLRSRLGRVTLVLFGSYARGDFNAWSDVDLILVWEGFQGVRPVERWRLIRELVEEAPGPLDLVLWSPEEARAMLARPSWRKALSSGCLLLADDYRLLRDHCGGKLYCEG